MKCAGQDCEKEAKMQCPTCKKLGQQTLFCDQVCFKKNWPLHKLSHVQVDPFPGYEYTGTLRPHYPLSPYREVPAHIPRPDYAEDGVPRSERSVKASQITALTDEGDLLKMRQACGLGRLVLDHGASMIKVGVTTDDIDKAIHDVTVKYGAYPSPLMYRNFPKSFCSSVNEVICHGIPDKRPLQDGDIINLDVSVYFRGFHADLNETYLVHADDASLPKYAESLRLIETARTCLQEAIKICAPGTRYREVGDVINKLAHKRGHSVVRSYCGHGINKLFHCIPNVPHYNNNKAIGTMRKGHTFTIEPMINAGVWQDDTWPDGWTSVTVDGARSAQFEETLLITDTGVEILTASGNDKLYFDSEGLLPQFK